jgi:CubicO group peptidase (beta-lactamase class C family)
MKWTMVVMVAETIIVDSVHFTPGSRYEYPNTGHTLLGHPVEEISGKDYYSYMKENAFIPAGMKSMDHYDV